MPTSHAGPWHDSLSFFMRDCLDVSGGPCILSRVPQICTWMGKTPPREGLGFKPSRSTHSFLQVPMPILDRQVELFVWLEHASEALEAIHQVPRENKPSLFIIYHHTCITSSQCQLIITLIDNILLRGESIERDGHSCFPYSCSLHLAPCVTWARTLL